MLAQVIEDKKKPTNKASSKKSKGKRKEGESSFSVHIEEKYFEAWTIPLQTFENFEGGLVGTLKKTRFLTGLNNV